MQIEIYNMIPADDKLSITLEAVCDSFSSLLWDIEYYACGVFEVYIAASPKNIEIFRTGRIVGRDDDKEHYGLIESVQLETDAEDGDYLIVSGRFLMCLLERRIIYPTFNFTKKVSYAQIVNNVVQYNACRTGARKIPGLSIGDSSGSCWNQNTKLQISYDNLMKWVYTICEKIGGTANVRLSKTTDEQYEMLLELSEGIDRSILQSENPILYSQTDTTICFLFPIPQIFPCKGTTPTYWEKAKEKRENVPHILTVMSRNILTAMRCTWTQRIWRTKNRKTAQPNQSQMQNTSTFYRKKARRAWCSHLWFLNPRLRYSLRSFSITRTILSGIM